MVEISIQQHDAIEASGQEPVRAIDPATQAEYVILRAEAFDRIMAMISDETWSENAYAAALPVLARDGWDDPRMDVYNELDPRKKP